MPEKAIRNDEASKTEKKKLFGKKNKKDKKDEKIEESDRSS